MDVKTAFLNDRLKETIYMQQQEAGFKLHVKSIRFAGSIVPFMD